MQLICAFVFAYVNIRFSHDAADSVFTQHLKEFLNNVLKHKLPFQYLTVSHLFYHQHAFVGILYEPHHEKTNILHMRKQRRRSASR